MSGPKHILVVFTECMPGEEVEYNRWYNETHVADVLSVNGIEAVQRFRLTEMEPEQTSPHRFLGIYEITGDPKQVSKDLVAGRDQRYMSPAYDAARTARWYFSAVTDRETTRHVLPSE